MPGPLPPGPAALNFENKSKCPALVLVPFPDTPRSPDGCPQPHLHLVEKVLAFAEVYVKRNRYMRFGEAVGIIVAHKKTEVQFRRRLKAERSAWNGDTNFGLEDRFDDQASEACSYWVRILAGQTAMSQTVDCALDARLLCKQVYRSIIPTSGVDHTRSLLHVHIRREVELACMVFGKGLHRDFEVSWLGSVLPFTVIQPIGRVTFCSSVSR